MLILSVQLFSSLITFVLLHFWWWKIVIGCWHWLKEGDEGFFFFLRELISLVREVTQFKSVALTAAKQKWTVKVCFHLFLPHLFSSFWWHLFLDLTHFSPPKRVGVKGPRSLQKKMKKNVTCWIFFFFFTPETLQMCVCFICMCWNSIWGGCRQIKPSQLHVTQAVLNQNKHLRPGSLCGSQKKKALGLPGSVSIWADWKSD